MWLYRKNPDTGKQVFVDDDELQIKGFMDMTGHTRAKAEFALAMKKGLRTGDTPVETLSEEELAEVQKELGK